MTVTIINKRKAVCKGAGGIKELSTGTAVVGMVTNHTYMVCKAGILRLSDGHLIEWSDISDSAIFVEVNLEISVL